MNIEELMVLAHQELEQPVYFQFELDFEDIEGDESPLSS